MNEIDPKLANKIKIPMPANRHDRPDILMGWREWLALPALGLHAIKAKVDTGARTSALHAFEVERFKRDCKDYMRFSMHPLQRNERRVVQCEARLIDERDITDSGGHQERRYVIETDLVVADARWSIEMTLTNRDNMRFRMLLGRSAMQDRIWVDSSRSYLCGKLDYRLFYKN